MGTGRGEEKRVGLSERGGGSGMSGVKSRIDGVGEIGLGFGGVDAEGGGAVGVVTGGGAIRGSLIVAWGSGGAGDQGGGGVGTAAAFFRGGAT